MEALNLEFQYTEAEAVRAANEFLKNTNKIMVLMPWLGGFLLAMILILAFDRGKDILSKDILRFGGALFIAVSLISTRVLIRWSTKKNFRKNPSANGMIRWTINEAELRSETEGAEVRFDWDRLIKVGETKSGFLLFLQPRLAHWLPKRAFQGDTEIDVFRSLVMKHGIKLKG